jgi:hypothetical protein
MGCIESFPLMGCIEVLKKLHKLLQCQKSVYGNAPYQKFYFSDSIKYLVLFGRLFFPQIKQMVHVIVFGNGI